MGGSCATYERHERCIQGFGGETLKRDHLEDLGLNRTIILDWIAKKWEWLDGMY
jgi:hypothetical protein